MEKLMVKWVVLVEKKEEDGGGGGVDVVGMEEEMKERKVEELVVEKVEKVERVESGRPKEGTTQFFWAATTVSWK